VPGFDKAHQCHLDEEEPDRARNMVMENGVPTMLVGAAPVVLKGRHAICRALRLEKK
jgi:hypothetical protein